MSNLCAIFAARSEDGVTVRRRDRELGTWHGASPRRGVTGINRGFPYFFGGHDHVHDRAVVLSPDGASAVQDITASK